LDEDPEQRKPNKYKSGNFHHQNPFVLRTLIDQDHKKLQKQNMVNRKRSNSNFNRDASSGHSSRANNDKVNAAKQKSSSANGNFDEKS
jgi:hypothetical protein